MCKKGRRMAGQEHHWIAVWTASPQGPYPVGNPSAQPDLSAVLPDPQRGAADQTFRMIVRPSVWGRAVRIRFTNVFGRQPLAISHPQLALDGGGGGVLPGTSVALTCAGKDRAIIPAGGDLWSDPVSPAFLLGGPEGRNLAISFHVEGETGPLTWHAKALQTSYIAPPGSSVTEDETGLAFPFTTTSWFLIDAVDMDVPGGRTIAAFGDSLTDGTFSTLNGNDRWPDVLRRRLMAAGHPFAAVVNAGIGGNQILGPARYDRTAPVPGGPSALDRLARDVLGLSGLHAVIWLEGINDGSANGCADPAKIIAGLQQGVAMMRAARPALRILGATIPGATGSAVAGHGSAAQEACRQAVNHFIRTGGVFDAVCDFAAVTSDPETGALLPLFKPDSTMGGLGDGLHPNRAGYAAMAAAIDLAALNL